MAELSVVIPVYNAEKYLPDCLASLEKQTIFEIMEIIFVNDGSTDTSPSIIRDFASKHGNVKTIDLENGGVSRARNTGIEAACGGFIGFCDSDDTLEETYYENLLAAVKRAGASFSFCGLTFDRAEGRRPQPPFFPEGEVLRGREGIRTFAEKMLTDGSQNSTVNKVFRASLIRDNGIRFPLGVKIGEDKRFVLDFLRVADSLVCAGGCGYYYRDVGSSAMHASDKMEKLLATFDDEVRAFTSLGIDAGEAVSGKSVFLFHEFADYLQRCRSASKSLFVSEAKRYFGNEALFRALEPGLGRVRANEGRIYSGIAAALARKSLPLLTAVIDVQLFINRERH